MPPWEAEESLDEVWRDDASVDNDGGARAFRGRLLLRLIVALAVGLAARSCE